MSGTKWRAKGLLFENCNCQLVCPAHISFKPLCTHERCIGHWSVHIEEGRFGDVVLDGLNAVIVYDSPRHMFSGGWTELFYVDERADAAQREALETIFSGKAGGPWEVLARFVARRLPTRYVPLRFEDGGRRKRMRVDDLFDTTVPDPCALPGARPGEHAACRPGFPNRRGGEPRAVFPVLLGSRVAHGAGLTAFLLLEKGTSWGQRLGRAGGLLLVGLGLWMLASGLPGR